MAEFDRCRSVSLVHDDFGRHLSPPPDRLARRFQGSGILRRSGGLHPAGSLWRQVNYLVI